MITDNLFSKVETAAEEAYLVAWDGCHKIYLAMDTIEAAWFRANYKHWEQGTPEQMIDAVVSWWDQSCPLRFVQSVSNNADDPNLGFETLIPQGGGDIVGDEDDEYEEEEV
jgi:hypothetical protein